MKTKLCLIVGTKKYEYTLTKKSNEVSHIFCEKAKIDQDFLNEDIPALIMDLPNLIEAEKSYQSQKNRIVRFRVSEKEKLEIEKKAHKRGFSTSEYLRSMALS